MKRNEAKPWFNKGLLVNLFVFLAGCYVNSSYVLISSEQRLFALYAGSKDTFSEQSCNPEIAGSSMPLSLSETAEKEFTPRISLHPKWKMWHEMNSTQQQGALNALYPYLDKYGSLAKGNLGFKGGGIKQGNCSFETFGSFGRNLCNPPPPPGNCTLISFGIFNDPTFDIDIANLWKCRGFASDPTVTHPSKLHDLVTFHNFAATLLAPNECRTSNKGGNSEWWETSMPRLRQFLQIDTIDILKLDCEGCEHALARDIISEDPEFLTRVNQLSIETHVTKAWINTTEAFYYFALHFALVEEAGFTLESSSLFGCGKFELTGCHPEFLKTEYPCAHRFYKADPLTGVRFPRGISCQEYLWRRYV